MSSSTRARLSMTASLLCSSLYWSMAASMLSTSSSVGTRPRADSQNNATMRAPSPIRTKLSDSEDMDTLVRSCSRVERTSASRARRSALRYAVTMSMTPAPVVSMRIGTSAAPPSAMTWVVATVMAISSANMCWRMSSG